MQRGVHGGVAEEEAGRVRDIARDPRRPPGLDDRPQRQRREIRDRPAGLDRHVHGLRAVVVRRVEVEQVDGDALDREARAPGSDAEQQRQRGCGLGDRGAHRAGCALGGDGQHPPDDLDPAHERAVERRDDLLAGVPPGLRVGREPGQEHRHDAPSGKRAAQHAQQVLAPDRPQVRLAVAAIAQRLEESGILLRAAQALDRHPRLVGDAIGAGRLDLAGEVAAQADVLDADRLHEVIDMVDQVRERALALVHHERQRHQPDDAVALGQRSQLVVAEVARVVVNGAESA